MDTFGEWLRQQRIERRLTREELAGRVSCSVAMLRKIEDGERRPSIQIAELIANSLDIPPEARAAFVKVARGELGVDRLSALGPEAAHMEPAGEPPLRTNLPISPTPLMGRQQEVEELSRFLQDPQCRLLTLVGPGGVGKTHLAVETAARMVDAFADGVFFVPLAAANTPRLIVPMIADAVGFPFSNTNRTDPKTQLFHFLHQKQALLLLDNLEQLLVEPGIELLAELLSGAPRVTLLATSREALGLRGEWVYEVHGLPVPPGEIGLERLQDAAQFAAVDLFLHRARQANLRFHAAPEDILAAARICRLVEGNPLAIEMAAAWTRVLSCSEIAAELERGTDILRTTSRDVPPRHRSMRAVFDHSWNLLNEEEQRVLLALSVFQGGFRREAGEWVAGATLPVLSALAAKSLVRKRGSERYSLHEVIRQYAAERLGEHPEEQAAVEARCSSYYLRLFSRSDERLRSSEQQKALADLTNEMDNFRAAWNWAVSNGRFAWIHETLRVITTLFDIRGWLQEGQDLLGHLVTVLETSPDLASSDRVNQITLGHALCALAVFTARLGQYEQAQAMLERSLEILRPFNEPDLLVEPVTYLGMVLELAGKYDAAMESYSAGLETAELTGDRWFAALCRTCMIDQLGIVQGQMPPAEMHGPMQSVLKEWRAIGDPRMTAFALNIFSWNAMKLGRFDEARAALEESITLEQSTGDSWGLGYAYRGLGLVAQAEGNHQQAVKYFQVSLDTFTGLGARQDAARILAEMGQSVFALGNDDEAGSLWRESLRLATETQGVFIALEALAGIASVQARCKNLEYALELLTIAIHHPAVLPDTKARADRLRMEIESQMAAPQVKAVQSRALENTFENAVGKILRG